jgi:predicted outer membrane repeat protein
MNYFDPYSPSADDGIVAAWDSQVVALLGALRLPEALAAGYPDLFARFAACYADLLALPRVARRALQKKSAAGPRAILPACTRRNLARTAAGAAFLLALGEGPALANTITVSAKTPPGVNDGDGRCSLVEAIVNANADAATFGDCVAGGGDDVVVMPKGVQTFSIAYANYNGDTALPLITSAITITGNKTKFMRANNAPPFRFAAVAPSGRLTLENVILSGGSAANGGAITNYGSLILNHATVSGSTASGNGGAIFNFGYAKIAGGTLSKNSAVHFGGGIYSRGGSTSVVLENSEISRNTAGSGGGILNYVAAMSIESSIITGNTATLEGGAIANYGGALRVERSTISKNTAGRTAGGLDNVYATAEIYDSTITGNKAMYGGGIENFGDATNASRLYVYGSTLSKNTASMYGGAVANIDGFFNLDGSAVTGNKAATRGGGVFNAGPFHTFIETNNTFSKNSAPNGADIYP